MYMITLFPLSTACTVYVLTNQAQAVLVDAHLPEGAREGGVIGRVKKDRYSNNVL